MKRFSIAVLFASLFTVLLSAQTQIQLPFAVPESAVILAPTVSAVGSGGSCTAGAHSVAVSFVTNTGDETGIGNANSATCVASDSLSLTVIPLGSQYVTSRNIWVTKAGTTFPFYFAQSIANNTSTTATFTLADASMSVQLVPKATPPARPLWAVWSTGEIVPQSDNSYPIGTSSFRASSVNTFKTQVYNATSGNITVSAPTGALGTPVVSLPALTGSMPTIYSCGASLAAAAACANTAILNPHFVVGSFLLAGNTSTVTGISPAFTNATSWWCVANDVTTRANPVQAIPASGSSVVITNTTGATDLIQLVCFGN